MFVVLIALVIHAVFAQNPVRRDSEQKPQRSFQELDNTTGHQPRNKPADVTLQAPAASEEESCGAVKIGTTPLVAYEESTSEGDWPWHAAIYRSGEYKCSGSLISRKHVLTAAHCVTQYSTYTTVNEELLRIDLGKNRLNEQTGHVQSRGVSQITIHPDYQYVRKNDDIAVVELDRAVEITGFVRHVCLWEQDQTLDTIVARFGRVVGWGKDKTGSLSKCLMQAVLPLVLELTEDDTSVSVNYSSHPTLDKYFCADIVNGTTACLDDSGGGMVFTKGGTGNTRIWKLRGVMSSKSYPGEKCESSRYFVFSDVAYYMKWIKPIIQ